LPDSSSGKEAEEKGILNSQVDSQNNNEKTSTIQVPVNKDIKKTVFY